MSELVVLQQTRGERVAALSHLVSNLKRWLSSLAQSEVLPAAKPTSITSGGNVYEQIEVVRTKILDLKARAERIKSAPISSSEAKQLARAQIDKLAASGRPDCYRLIERVGQIEWPTSYVSFAGPGTPLIGDNIPDAIALFAWMNTEGLYTAVSAEIDRCADDDNALSGMERDTQLKKAQGDILSCERQEEVLMEMAGKLGLELLRRSDADPRAVLGLAGELPPA